MEKKVVGSLLGVDGNAFSLLGHFNRLAKEQGLPRQDVDKVLSEAMSGNYDELIVCLDSNMECQNDG